MAVSELPPGFVLDQPAGLPPGFVLDTPSIGEDAAKSVGAGLGQAAVSTLGMGGDIRELATKGLDLAGSKLGFDPSGVKSAVSAAANVIPPLGFLKSAPSSQDIRSTISDPIVSPDYQPKTALGGVLKTGAEFLPAMADPELAGPAALRAAGRLFASRVAAPALSSEAAGALTQGTAAEPYARVAGAFAGAGGASAAAQKFQEMAAARRAASAVPSAEDLLGTARGQFKAAENMGLVVSPDFVTKTAADMRQSLRGFDPEGQAAVFKAVDRLESLVGPSSPVAMMNDVELIRKQLTNLKMSSDAPTREAARKALTSLVDAQKGVTAADVVAGNAAAYSKIMQDAVGNYAAGKRSNTVMGKAALGDLNAATAGSGANEDNALRQAIKQLVRPVNNDIVPKAQRLGFNQAEIDAMNQVARGTPAGNAARYLGKLAPTGSVSGAMSAGAGYGAAGPFGAVALPAAGYLAKKIGDMSTKSAIKTLDSLVRSRSPLAQQVAAQLPPQLVAQLPTKTQAILQTLALSAPPLRQQIGQPVGQPSPQ
jgi:hypothetical protein